MPISSEDNGSRKQRSGLSALDWEPKHQYRQRLCLRSIREILAVARPFRKIPETQHHLEIIVVRLTADVHQRSFVSFAKPLSNIRRYQTFFAAAVAIRQYQSSPAPPGLFGGQFGAEVRCSNWPAVFVARGGESEQTDRRARQPQSPLGTQAPIILSNLELTMATSERKVHLAFQKSRIIAKRFYSVLLGVFAALSTRTSNLWI